MSADKTLDATLDDIETELFAGMPALLALDKIGEAQLRRWWRGAIDRVTATAIASAQRDLDAIADLDAAEVRAELEA